MIAETVTGRPSGAKTGPSTRPDQFKSTESTFSANSPRRRRRRSRVTIFTGTNGGFLNPNFMREIWYKAIDKSKLRRRTVYQTRHSFASNALAAGESPSWVAAQLGHATAQMLFRVYARYIPNRTRHDGSALLARLVETKRGRDTGILRANDTVTR